MRVEKTGFERLLSVMPKGEKTRQKNSERSCAGGKLRTPPVCCGWCFYT
jgi:hypothetical protein